MNLSLFLSNDNLRNTWIKEKDIEVYIRRSVRIIENKMHPCLDIGSVEVKEKKRGRGTFSCFLNRFEEEAKKLNRCVYIESILNPRLIKYLLGKGYQFVPGTSEISPNMYKFTS